jgi:hypothetical protein
MNNIKSGEVKRGSIKTDIDAGRIERLAAAGERFPGTLIVAVTDTSAEGINLAIREYRKRAGKLGTHDYIVELAAT